MSELWLLQGATTGASSTSLDFRLCTSATNFNLSTQEKAVASTTAVKSCRNIVQVACVVFLLHHILLDSLQSVEAVRSAGLLLVITVRLGVQQHTASRERRSGVLGARARRILGGWRHVVNARGPRVHPTGCSLADVRVVSSSDDASITEPLPSLPWPTIVAAHRKALQETAIWAWCPRLTSEWCRPCRCSTYHLRLPCCRRPSINHKSSDPGCTQKRTKTVARSCARQRNRARLRSTENRGRSLESVHNDQKFSLRLLKSFTSFHSRHSQPWR